MKTILLTLRSGNEIRVNPEHIVAYHDQTDENSGARIITVAGAILVSEPAAIVDLLIAGTPMEDQGM